MKIGYIVQQFYPSAYGSGVHAFELSQELTQLGHEIHIITKGEPFEKNYEVLKGIHVHRILRGIKIPYYFPTNALLLWRFGSRIAKNLDLDIIIGHGFESGLFIKMRKVTPFLYKAAGTIGVQQFRKYVDWRDLIGRLYFPILGHIEGAAINYSNLTIAISDAIKRELIATYSVSKDKIIRIYNGVNPQRFKPSRINSLKIDLNLTKRKVILFAGRLSPIKAPHLLVQAIPGIVREIPNAIFLFLGDGPLRSYLRYYVRKFRIENYVKFLGFVPNSIMPKYYSMADLCVIPSLYEPFGLVALESLASGTPILSSNIGGLAEIHQFLQNFPILKTVTPQNIREVVVNLMAAPAKLERLGAFGRAMACKKFSWRKCAKKTLKVIQKIKKRE
ncbi:MAG: glycosyltransferase family 4 protein [Candidatus Helarchaeota archaeon]